MIVYSGRLRLNGCRESRDVRRKTSMNFRPIDLMLDRVNVARTNNDVDLFNNLMYLGEMLTKLVAAGLIAVLEDNHDRQQYRLIHRLVRANGIGEWSAAIGDVLTGLPSTHLRERAAKESQELTSLKRTGTWQHDSVQSIHRSMESLGIADAGALPERVAAKSWFANFATLRNRTRGHGAITGTDCSNACIDLEKSLMLLIENLSLFRRPWAYLKRNLSYKYRVTPLTPEDHVFDELRHDPSYSFEDGVYVFIQGMHRVELLETTAEARDFYLPNGRFSKNDFEILSYITGDIARGDASRYLLPADQLPASETQGRGALTIQGNCFGNLPPQQDGYVDRVALERELMAAIIDDRHPMITLVGRGGVGKTWLALRVLHDVVNRERFGTVVWFSARDIDLLSRGPATVAPHVLNETDMAKEYYKLVEFTADSPKSSVAVNRLAEDLGSSGKEKTLFVYDNFETVRNPVELYTWLDTYVRLPNKVLITTRFREFRGDYAIDVGGMNPEECRNLILEMAGRLGIGATLTTEYRESLIRESGGHPYVIRMLLGEVAKSKALRKPERVIAGREDVLEALFERSYGGLSPVARRVFLTLCGWRSTVPEVALEAALLRPENERMDVEMGIEELARYSMIEIAVSEKDGMRFISVPIAAMSFGVRKLRLSPNKTAIMADIEILQAFGAAQQTDIQHGLEPRIRRLFRNVARDVDHDPSVLDKSFPMLEFIGRRYPSTWLLLADLYEERHRLEDAKKCVQRYLESVPDSSRSIWSRLEHLCKSTGDWMGQAHCLLAEAELPDASLERTSAAANTVVKLLREGRLGSDEDQRRVLTRRFSLLMGESMRENEPAAIDYARLAWLFLLQGEESEALRATMDGLEIDSRDSDCMQLMAALEEGT